LDRYRSDRRRGKGAAIGAGVAEAPELQSWWETRGKEIKYAPEQKLTFTLSEDLKVPLP